MGEETPETIITGLAWPDGEGDAYQALHLARVDGFEFVTTRLPTSPQTYRNDVAQLESRFWSTSVVGHVKTPENLVFQLKWAWHMNLPAVILPKLPPSGIEEYARQIYSLVLEAEQNRAHLWVPVTMNTANLQLWQRLHALCDSHAHLGILLLLEPHRTHSDLPASLQLLHTFLGLPVRAIEFACDPDFMTNQKGYPTLSKHNQHILSELLCRIGRTVRILVHGNSVHMDVPNTGETGCLSYLQYLQHFRTSRQEIVAALDTAEKKMETNYLDILQRPLQPLKDHLEFNTYETFEKDPVKYQKYQEAIARALADRKGDNCVLAVVGAGRGPLVNCAIRAYQASKNKPKQFRLFAVEKNPSAVLFLQSLAKSDTDWRKLGVHVVHTDLRSIKSSDLNNQTAHIVVSELLGSFGCNELSPECLDGLFETDVCTQDTVSIPCRYISRLAPMSSMKLHAQVQSQALYPNEQRSGVIGSLEAFETPYVVRAHAASQTHLERDCWEFEHPSSLDDGNRHATLDFSPDSASGCGTGSGYLPYNAGLADVAQTISTPHSWTMTGLVGTFTAVLYASKDPSKQVQISTSSSSFSEGMFSWFPLYFPLKTPIYIPMSANVKVDIWRRTDPANRKVWYEWTATVHRHGETLAVAPIHNPSGRSYYVAS